MFIINNRKFFFFLSGLLIFGSFVSMYVYGLNLGIDFKGGSLLEVSYPELSVETMSSRPTTETVKENLDKLGLGNYVLTPSGDSNFILKTRDLDPTEKIIVMSAFQSNPDYVAKEERFNSIGPVVGSELRSKAIIAISVVVICILAFITFAFRHVSLPVASWKYGIATIVALAHDVIIPTGIFVVYSKFSGAEIDLLFISALLAISGYSVHDTIVVFDRVRENLKTGRNEQFDKIVGNSLLQTIGRSINTSFTTFLALITLYFIGGESTQHFAFILLVGIIVGTYSSIFVASPLLVTLEKLQKK
mgnify:CR=1 FL=1